MIHGGRRKGHAFELNNVIEKSRWRSFDIKVKKPNGAVLVVLDLEPELIIERTGNTERESLA